MFLGVPVSWSLIIASLAGALAKGGIPITVIAQRMFAAGESYPMLAIPAFFLAGDIMCMGGISKRLTDFVDAILGWLSGALSLVSITACTFFAAISGSATATTSAIGSIMIPEMVKKGYPPSHAAACQSIGGTLGPVIPPSIIFIFYANATSISISQLQVSGIIPGCFPACCYVHGYILAESAAFQR
jgi:C4-dicarboxylate transporter DctM subunit